MTCVESPGSLWSDGLPTRTSNVDVSVNWRPREGCGGILNYLNFGFGLRTSVLIAVKAICESVSWRLSQFQSQFLVPGLREPLWYGHHWFLASDRVIGGMGPIRDLLSRYTRWKRQGTVNETWSECPRGAPCAPTSETLRQRCALRVFLDLIDIQASAKDVWQSTDNSNAPQTTK